MSGWDSEMTFANYANHLDASNLIGDLQILEIWQPYLTVVFLWDGNLGTLENFFELLSRNLILNIFEY